MIAQIKYTIHYPTSCGCKMYSSNTLKFINNISPHREYARHIDADCVDKEIEMFESSYGIKFYKEIVPKNNSKDAFKIKMRNIRYREKKKLQNLLKTV